MRDHKFRTIETGGESFRYACLPMPATKGLSVLTRLSNIVGETLLSMASGVKPKIPGEEGEEEEDLNPDIVEAAVKMLVKKLDEDEVVRLAVDIMEGMTVEGKKVGLNDRTQFDEHFAGRIMLLFKVIMFGLEVNFQDFFEGNPFLQRKAVREEHAA